ncbi:MULTISPECIES: thioredoxin family protein [Methanothermococcus]|jgi:thioredoxin 1|uniref:thioredoxin family protein n=1 Tax=Methanothermococcus TaxID=155862 RepID=UPI00035F8FA5|nr:MULTISPECIES: thioredoxin family protein [Methanothermococcus]
MSSYSKILISLFFMVLFAGCLDDMHDEDLNDSHQIMGHQKYTDLNLEGKTVVLEFYADWCGYCRALEPTINQLENEGVEVIRINTDENPDLANQYGVRALPTIIYIKDGKAVDITIGYKPEEVKEKAKKLYE